MSKRFMAITLDVVKRAMRAKSVEFDGDGHIFWLGPNEYDAAQEYAKSLMDRPKSERPRGWSRGSHHGIPFVKIRLH